MRFRDFFLRDNDDSTKVAFSRISKRLRYKRFHAQFNARSAPFNRKTEDQLVRKI